MNKTISVFKLDVEGEEFNSMPQILASNMFERIDQIHLEVVESSKRFENNFPTQYNILYLLPDLKQLLCFRYIRPILSLQRQITIDDSLKLLLKTLCVEQRCAIV